MSTPTPPSGEGPRDDEPTGDGQHGNGQDGYGQYGYGQYGQSPPPGGEAPGAPEQPGQAPQQPSSGWGATPPPPSGWGEVPQAPSYGSPSSSEPASYGQYGQAGPGQAFAVAQPGIIPLRPLTLGEIYDGAFKAIRANPGVMFGLAAVVVVVVTAIQGALTWGAFEELNRFAGMTDPGMADIEDMYGSLLSTFPALIAGSVVTFLATTLLNGVLIHSVSQSVIGRRLDLGALWPLLRPQLLRLVGLTLLVGLAVGVLTVLPLVPGLLVLGAGDPGLGAGLMLLGLLAAIALAVFGVVVTVLATPALVLERAGVITALKRSWELTRRTFWRVAGIYLLTVVLVGIIAQVIVTPVTMLAQLGGSLTAVTVASLVGSAIASAVTTPFMAAVIALLYVDIRIRREGLDAELAAAAQTEA